MPLAASDEGPPDENPNFDTFAELEDYPYTMRQDIRATETVHSWHALYLENEYLKCTILPQLGGHIYTCVDKINGKPMFYANPSFKKAIIAYRGAWSAFGEEFNFPISHNWVTISPVDWAYSTAADGSASVTVGNRDRVYGMDWTVEIVLRPGSTLLEEHVTLVQSQRRSPSFLLVEQRRRRSLERLQNLLPDAVHDRRRRRQHRYLAGQFEGERPQPRRQSSWRVLRPSPTAAPSLSWESTARIPTPESSTGPTSRQCRQRNYFPGGTTATRLDWRNRLSDNHSTYVEVQSGLFRDQTTYEFLEPRQSIRFTEFWMPVRGIGSIARANLNGVVAMERTRQKDGKIALKSWLQRKPRHSRSEDHCLRWREERPRRRCFARPCRDVDTPDRGPAGGQDLHLSARECQRRAASEAHRGRLRCGAARPRQARPAASSPGARSQVLGRGGLSQKRDRS